MLRRERPREHGDWIRIATAPNEVVAGMLEGALKDKGIPVMEKKMSLDYVAGMAGMRGILVPVDREEEARSLLSEIWDMTEDS
jgi:hypothetical protein